MDLLAGIGTLQTFDGPLITFSDSQNRISIDNSMTITLTTDIEFNKMEKFSISLISGVYSGEKLSSLR